MSKTLTEQWRDGTLENGFYYVMSGWSTSIEIRYLGNGFFEGNIKVLAPVPSYEEYQRLQEQMKEANEMLKGAKHLTVKDSNGAVMFELVSPEINEYIKKWGVE